MEYNRIVAVTGLPGLYEILSSKNDGALVRSVEDKSTKFISSRIHNLSHLESIEIYTTGENVNLSEVFLAMQDGGVALPDAKDAKALKGYFEQVFPSIDFARVYNSDMKKMVKWFEIIKGAGITFHAAGSQPEATDAPAQEIAGEENAPVAETEAKPKKAPAKKKAAPKAEGSLFGEDASAEAQPDSDAEAKPKKKAAPKKKKEDPAE